MKILLLTIEYPPFKGGVANYYKNLVANWPNKDELSVLDNNNHKLLSKTLKPAWLKSFFSLYKAIKANKISHVIVGQILPLGTVAWLLSKFMKFDYSVIIHGMDFDFALKVKRKKILTKKILAGSSCIICSNTFVAKKVKEFVADEKKVFVVNPGINVEYRAEEIREEKSTIEANFDLSGKFVLFSVSRLVKRKGIDTSIEAVQSLVEKYPNLYYYIAGTGPDEEYLIEKAKGLKNIVFLGKISDKQKWVWLSCSDLFIMPSREIDGDYEGFGIVYLEANLLGKAVVAGRSGGVKDAVVDYETGILCDPLSSEDVEGAIDELYSSFVLRDELGQNGMRRAAEEFTWKEQIKKIYNIIAQ